MLIFLWRFRFLVFMFSNSQEYSYLAYGLNIGSTIKIPDLVNGHSVPDVKVRFGELTDDFLDTFTTLQNCTPSDLVHAANLNIRFADMAITILQLIFIPLLLGFSLNNYFPNIVTKIKGFIKILSFAIFIGFVVGAVANNLDNLVKYLHIVFFIVLIHNGLALTVGYFWSKIILQLPTNDARTISIETGIQNSGLALILIFNFFDKNGGMALLAAWWSVWHLISAVGIAWFWGRDKISIG